MSWINDKREQFDQWRTDRREWGSAHTLEDLGERNRAWLRGELEQTPGHGGPANEETELIRGDLDKLNERGFVTVGSQPGLHQRDSDGTEWDQRAWVEGYGSDETAARIRDAAAASRCADDCGHDGPAITVHTQRVADMGRRTSNDAEAVTLRDGEPVTGSPLALSRSDHGSMWSRWINDDAYTALDESHRITAVDNHWGDSRTLWNVLDRAWDDEEAER